MALHFIVLLYLAGLVGGMLSSMVGGAAVVTYPALIATGISPLTATVCNLTASFPGTMSAALSDRGQLPPFDRAFVVMVAVATLAGALGGTLLLATPERVFALLVPVLVGFATALFAFARQIGDWLRARAAARGREHKLGVADLKLVLPVAFYGGYFGAGVGFLMLSVMSVATHGDYRSANVAKNFVMSLNCGAAAVIFIAKGAVIWPQTLALMAGTVSGGVTGAWLARIVPRKIMRVSVIVLGTLLTVYFAWRYWF